MVTKLLYEVFSFYNFLLAVIFFYIPGMLFRIFGNWVFLRPVTEISSY